MKFALTVASLTAFLAVGAVTTAAQARHDDHQKCKVVRKCTVGPHHRKVCRVTKVCKHHGDHH